MSAFKQKRDYFERFLAKKNEVCLDEIKIGKQLGCGGFGTVSECFVAGKRYAIKKFHVHTRNAKAAHESFLSEKTAGTLRHRHIVRIHDTFTRDNVYFVLMEYVSTKTLQRVIDNSDETLDHNRRIKFAKHIASGLAYAHRKNIAHLDLKPANILVSSTTDECKIADFGCCKVIDDNTTPTTPTKSNLTGTYSYRAPELLRGDAASVKADIYSFGICLWQMVTRERPYGNENHQVIIFKIVAYNERPVLPDHISEEETEYFRIMKLCWDECTDKRPAADSLCKCLS